MSSPVSASDFDHFNSLNKFVIKMRSKSNAEPICLLSISKKSTNLSYA